MTQLRGLCASIHSDGLYFLMKEQNDSLDIFKAVLAVMVIAIHSGLLPNLLFPWLRLSVPAFFLMSSYLFFKGSRDIGKFLRRLLCMYCAWFLVLLPITLFLKKELWFASYGWAWFFRDLFLGSTFPASWFFSALAESVLIVYLLRKFMCPNILLILSFIPFAFSCCCSSYPSVFSNYPLLGSFRDAFSAIANPLYSFCAAIFWVCVGIALAEKSGRAQRTRILPMLIMGLVLLYGEWRYVYVRYGKLANDCYFSLPAVVIPMFVLVRDCGIKFKFSLEARFFSIMSYPLHFSIIKCIRGAFKMIGVSDANGVCVFSATIVSVVAICFAVRAVENRGFSYTKILH